MTNHGAGGAMAAAAGMGVEAGEDHLVGWPDFDLKHWLRISLLVMIPTHVRCGYPGSNRRHMDRNYDWVDRYIMYDQVA